jgi:hypothetical protein
MTMEIAASTETATSAVTISVSVKPRGIDE